MPRTVLSRIIFISLLLACSLTSSLQAASLNSGDYQGRQDVEAFIDRMAKKGLYSEAELIELFSTVKKQSHLFKNMNRPAEKMHWYKYRPIFITKKRIQRGVDFYQKHKDLIDAISQKYQVPAEIMVAIVGVETFYGRIKGKAPVLDTLTTFAFDYPKRSKFFISELEHFLSLGKEHHIDIKSATGSYAGAMGVPQFISSSYRSYAVDHDGDGKTDLWDSPADILASVANYFKRHGWKPGEAITYPLLVSNKAQADTFSTRLKPSYEYQDLVRKGLKVDALKIAAKTPVSLISLKQKNKTDYWVGLNNFYVITRYNHSPLYAMAVFQLSEAIKKKI